MVKHWMMFVLLAMPPAVPSRRIDSADGSVTTGLVTFGDGLLRPALPGAGVQIEQKLPGGLQLQATQLRQDPVIPVPIPGLDLPSGIQDVNGVQLSWPRTAGLPVRIEGSVVERDVHQGIEPAVGSPEHDRERTQGLRVLAQDPRGRMELEGSLSHSQSLDGAAAEVIDRGEKQAHRVRGTVHLLKDRSVSGDKVANVRLEASEETVEDVPLERDAAASPATEKGRIAVVAGVGEMYVTAWQKESRDRTMPMSDRKTLSEGYEIILPVAELMGMPIPSTAWLPRILIRHEEAFEEAASTESRDEEPAGGSISIPLDRRETGLVGLGWEGARWQLSLEKSWTDQGDELTRPEELNRERGGKAELTLRPTDAIDIGTSVSVNSDALSAEESQRRVERGLSLGWSLLPGLRLSGRIDQISLEAPALEGTNLENRLTAEVRYRSTLEAGKARAPVEAYLRHSIVDDQGNGSAPDSPPAERIWTSDAGVTVKMF